MVVLTDWNAIKSTHSKKNIRNDTKNILFLN
jgi:hypothetical protein